MESQRSRRRTSLLFIAIFLVSIDLTAQTPCDISHATVAESEQKTAEVSTEELQRILSDGSSVVFDARPAAEYALSHIPGALNVSVKPGVSMSLYVSDVAEITRLVKSDKSRPIVLYCNGPFCGKSKRLASELLAEGFKNVKRYQLGIPVWRALGHVTQIESSGVSYVHKNDPTAVFIDARDTSSFVKGSIGNAKTLPRSGLKPGKDVGEVKAAKDDGRLPMEDHNTRIIVFGDSPEQARAVADAIAKEAFQNVSYFAGTFAEFKKAVR